MKKNFRTTAGWMALVLLMTACKQEYVPAIKETNVNLLVVEGFLNGGPGATTIRLSRTVDISSSAITKAETGAQVTVEGENGSRFTLAGNSDGEYSIAQLTLANDIRYRLRIRTTDGKEYLSDYTPAKYTPPLDSITWKREEEGVRLYVNTHDPQNATRYYQWDYEETWEFRSAFMRSLKYIMSSDNRIIGVEYLFPDLSIDTTILKCWKTLNSTFIFLGSTENLTADVVSLPFHVIQENSEKISVLYSINVNQYALSHEKYLFLQKMKKNTEQLGSLFDPQPSQLSGNIHCLTDPGEVVIGFIEVSQRQSKRIFIHKRDVGVWIYDPKCLAYEIDNHPDSLAKYATTTIPLMPTHISPTGAITKFTATYDTRCVDCRAEGRTNQRPSFWP